MAEKIESGKAGAYYVLIGTPLRDAIDICWGVKTDNEHLALIRKIITGKAIHSNIDDLVNRPPEQVY